MLERKDPWPSLCACNARTFALETWFQVLLLTAAPLVCFPRGSTVFCVFVHLWVDAPALWQTARWPVCSDSMPARCCSSPGCEGRGSGSSRSCGPETRPPRSGPVRCASGAQWEGASTGSVLKNTESMWIISPSEFLFKLGEMRK